MKNQGKTYTDIHGNVWRHGDVCEDGKIFRGLRAGKYAVFISQEKYNKLIAGNNKRIRVSRSEKRVSQRKKTVSKSMASARIQREIIELHERGKDPATIAMRLFVPVSAVQETIQAAQP